MLPADAGVEETQLVLSRLGAAFDADITVYSAGGEVIAGVGAALPFVSPDGRGGGPRRLLSARLPDGRVVVARLDGNLLGPPRARRSSGWR